MRAPRLGTRLGNMRHRIVIEEPIRSGDAGGGADITWQPVVIVWAEIQPKTGREVFESDQLGGRITHDVRIRYRDAITPKMRIQHRNRVFDIRHVSNVGERREWLICACEETTL